MKGPEVAGGSPIQPGLDPSAVAGLSAAQLAESGLVPLMPTPAVESPIAPVFNEDLARVQAVVEAAGGASQVLWAAGIVITGAGRQLVVTSDRGRGWLPAGAVLPADVVVPWSHPDSFRWEGLRDPARVIVEFAAAVGGRISALASTHSSAPAVAAGVPWVFADGTEQAHPELVGGLMVTRFELQVPQRHRANVRSIEDPFSQRQKALWVAMDADSRAGSMPARSAVLAGLHAGHQRIGDIRWVNSFDWAALEEAHREVCAQERASRVDVRDEAVGAVNTGGANRGLLAQAYAMEAVLALRNPVAERALMDAVYSWTLLLEIPPAPKVSPVNPVSPPGMAQVSQAV